MQTSGRTNAGTNFFLAISKQVHLHGAQGDIGVAWKLEKAKSLHSRLDRDINSEDLLVARKILLDSKVQVGDILLEIDNIAEPSFETLTSQLTQRIGQRTRLLLRRSGETQTVEVEPFDLADHVVKQAIHVPGLGTLHERKLRVLVSGTGDLKPGGLCCVGRIDEGYWEFCDSLVTVNDKPVESIEDFLGECRRTRRLIIRSHYMNIDNEIMEDRGIFNLPDDKTFDTGLCDSIWRGRQEETGLWTWTEEKHEPSEPNPTTWPFRSSITSLFMECITQKPIVVDVICGHYDLPFDRNHEKKGKGLIVQPGVVVVDAEIAPDLGLRAIIYCDGAIIDGVVKHVNPYGISAVHYNDRDIPRVSRLKIGHAKPGSIVWGRMQDFELVPYLVPKPCGFVSEEDGDEVDLKKFRHFNFMRYETLQVQALQNFLLSKTTAFAISESITASMHDISQMLDPSLRIVLAEFRTTARRELNLPPAWQDDEYCVSDNKYLTVYAADPGSGLMPGDIISTINGRRSRHARLCFKSSPVTFMVARNQETKQIQVCTHTMSEFVTRWKVCCFGMVLQQPPMKLRIHTNPRGLYISEVHKGSPAHRWEIPAASFLMSINGRHLEQEHDLKEALNKLPNYEKGELDLKLQRPDGTLVNRQYTLSAWFPPVRRSYNGQQWEQGPFVQDEISFAKANETVE